MTEGHTVEVGFACECVVSLNGIVSSAVVMDYMWVFLFVTFYLFFIR